MRRRARPLTRSRRLRGRRSPPQVTCSPRRPRPRGPDPFAPAPASQAPTKFRGKGALLLRRQNELGEGRGGREGRAVREYECLLQGAALRAAERGAVPVHAEPGCPCGARGCQRPLGRGGAGARGQRGGGGAHHGAASDPRRPAVRRPPPGGAAPQRGCAQPRARAAPAPAAAPGPAPRCLRGEGLGRAGSGRGGGSGREGDDGGGMTRTPPTLTIRGRQQLLLLLGARQQLPALCGAPGAQGSGQTGIHALRRQHPLEAAKGRAVVQRRSHPGSALGLSPRVSAEPEQGAPCGRGRGLGAARPGRPRREAPPVRRSPAPCPPHRAW